MPETRKEIGVIGAGAWGTTLAKVLAENGRNVTIWCHDGIIERDINKDRENKSLLPGIALPKNIRATTSLKGACSDKLMVVLVVASQYYEEVAKKIETFLSPETLILSATKGLNEKDGKRLSEILTDNLSPDRHTKIAVVSGPNISREIAEGKASATVVSSTNESTARAAQKLLNNAYLRVYTNSDVPGAELGGTLKNIIAIAAGIIDGLGLGNNAKSAVMVRGMVEMSRFAAIYGARPETLYGLTGMGDLITTCSSSLSRNHYVGEQLAAGQSATAILQNMTAVAEGIGTAKIIHRIAAEKKIDMPVTEQVYQVLFRGKSVQDALRELMGREMKSER